MEKPNWKYDVFYNDSNGLCFESSFKTKAELKETIKAHRKKGSSRPIFPVESWVFDSIYDKSRDIRRVTIYIRKPRPISVKE